MTEIAENEAREEKLLSFTETVSKADGTLIPLPGRKSRLGETLYISARIGQDELTPDETKYVNIDVFAKRNETHVPIGIKDYEIIGEIADGNKQRHQHLPRYNEAQEAADKFWSTGEGFHIIDTTFLAFANRKGMSGMNELRESGVIKDEKQWREPIYQKSGLGQLMIAVSALVLQRHDVEKIKLGSLTDSAKKTWRKFEEGIRDEIPVSELATHPNIKKSIEPFI